MEALRRYLEGHTELVFWLSLSSIVLFVGSLLLVPWLIVHAPKDVLVREAPRRTGVKRVAVGALRNTVGAVLVVSGVAMLILPGQGLLTFLLGVSLLDVPGKRKLVRHIAQRPSVWRGLCWIRQRGHRPPFDAP